ncbi:hypothetical protein DLP05_016 [Stenotrophomonas phage vB_SmaS_DLP_5]|uniref:Uncharacterized protein n=1 Tax=Stenotrophomonas phage vB_SmaS_DLP_5 TaxID=2044561 RepID=A0A2D2W2H4_9CAUD|nr:tail assembly chaperone [Stenotrophomonas phage vB_SmaS_DLP_5]ATS92333.1 hypothetical protein DLP05_016 [Stenotrophomonas phage vB_SmaS_DLP_5]
MAEKIEAAESKEAPAVTPKEQPDPFKELEVFGPEPEVMSTSIGEIEVRPMKMGQIRKMTNLGKELMPLVMQVVQQLKATGEISVTALGEITGDSFFQIIGIAINRKPEELDEMEPDEFVRVVAKVLVVNMDFFAQKLPQILAASAESVRREAQRTGVGRMLSKS